MQIYVLRGVKCLLVGVSALKIHLSENAHKAVKEFPGYITESRGNVFVKVKVTCSYITNYFIRMDHLTFSSHLLQIHLYFRQFVIRTSVN